jgi:hypothetical protein
MSSVNKLMSTNRSEILDGLREIGTNRINPPQGKILHRAIELLRFSDADVREEAVNAVGLHWQCPEAFPILLEMLKGQESDQVVLEAVVLAISTYRFDTRLDKSSTLEALATIALDSHLDSELRGSAYLSLQNLLGRITVTEFAKAPYDIKELEVDWEWLEETLLNQTEEIANKHSTGRRTSLKASVG